jgi:hypothetical protein
MYSRRCWTSLLQIKLRIPGDAGLLFLQIMKNLDVSVVQNSNEFENKRTHSVSLHIDGYRGRWSDTRMN